MSKSALLLFILFLLIFIPYAYSQDCESICSVETRGFFPLPYYSNVSCGPLLKYKLDSKTYLIYNVLNNNNSENKEFIFNAGKNHFELYHAKNLLFNVTSCTYSISQNQCLDNADIWNYVYWNETLQHVKFMRRFDLHYFTIRANSRIISSKLCPLYMQLTWPQNIYNFSDITNASNFVKALGLEEEYQNKSLILDDSITIQNYIIFDNDDYSASILYNQKSNQLIPTIIRDDFGVTKVYLCSNSTFLNLSILDGPHIYIFLKRFYKYDIIQEMALLSQIPELHVEFNPLYEYNLSDLNPFYDYKSNPHMEVELFISNSIKKKCDAIA